MPYMKGLMQAIQEQLIEAVPKKILLTLKTNYKGVYEEKKGKKITYMYKFSAATLDGERVHKAKRGFASAKAAFKAKCADKKAVTQLTTHAVKANTTQFVGLNKEYTDRLEANNMALNTLANYHTVYKNCVIPFFKDYTVDEITVSVLQSFKNKIMATKLADVTKNRYLNRLKTFLEHLHLFNHISREKLNSFLVIMEPPHIQIPLSSCKDIYTKEEYARLYNHIKNPKYKLAVQLLFNTGCRIGELLALQVKDLNFENKTVTFSKTLFTKRGKPAVKEGLKTERFRKIDLFDSSVKEVTEYIKKHNLRPNDFLFYGKRRSFPIVPNQVSQYFKIAYKELKLHHIRLHDFRHSHICYLLDMGVDPKVVADRVGHKNVAMTLSVYNQITQHKKSHFETLLRDL